MTLNFLDDVFLLYFALKTAERILERLAFLYANFCQWVYTSQPAVWLITEYGKLEIYARGQRVIGSEQWLVVRRWW